MESFIPYVRLAVLTLRARQFSKNKGFVQCNRRGGRTQTKERARKVDAFQVVCRLLLVSQVSQDAKSLVFSRLRRVIEFTRFARKEIFQI